VCILNEVYWEAGDGFLQDKNVNPLTGTFIEEGIVI
jgi:hypothetical protein